MKAWSMGLTPQLFWDQIEGSLNKMTPEEVEELVNQIVNQEKGTQNKAQGLHNQMKEIVQIGTTRMYIGSLANPLGDISHFGGVLVCSSKAVQMKSENILQLCIVDSKKDKSSLEKHLTKALRFIHSKLKNSQNVLILCDSGNNVSVAVCIAALCAFFDENCMVLIVNALTIR
jgi:hypothetical protein